MRTVSHIDCAGAGRIQFTMTSLYYMYSKVTSTLLVGVRTLLNPNGTNVLRKHQIPAVKEGVQRTVTS